MGDSGALPGGGVPAGASMNAAVNAGGDPAVTLDVRSAQAGPTQTSHAQTKLQAQSLDRKDPRGLMPLGFEGGIQERTTTSSASGRSRDLDVSNAAYMNMLASQGMLTATLPASVQPMTVGDSALSRGHVTASFGQPELANTKVMRSQADQMAQLQASALPSAWTSAKPIMTAEYVFDNGQSPTLNSNKEASSVQKYIDKSLWNQSDLSVAERLRAMTPHLYQNVAHSASRPAAVSDAVMVLEPAAVMINATPLYALRSVSDVGSRPTAFTKGLVTSSKDYKLSVDDTGSLGRAGLVDVAQLYPELTSEDVQVSELGYDYLMNLPDGAQYSHKTASNETSVFEKAAPAFVASEKLDLNAPTAQQNAVVLSAVRQAISRNTDSVRIKLNPENLGEVEVKLSKVGNTLSLEFQTSSLAARDVLSSSIGELKSGLEKSNYVLGDVRVEAKAVAKSNFEQFNTDFGNVFARDFLETRTQLGQSSSSRDGEWRDNPQQNYYADRDSSQQQRNDRRYRLYEEWNA